MKKVLLTLVAVVMALCATAATTTITWADQTANYPTKWSADNTVTADGFTFKLLKNKGATNPTYNANGKDLRVYAKGTIQITGTDNMSEIQFVISTAGLKRLAKITASVGTISGLESCTDKKQGDVVVKWTGNTKDVTFTVGDTSDYGTDGNSKAGQLDFISTTITTEDDTDPRQLAGLKWSDSEVTIRTNEIDDFTAPTLTNPNNVAVTYSSENEAVATITDAGVVTLTGKTGSAKITATFAGDTTYKPAEVSYTINVKIAVPTQDSTLENPYTVEEVLAVIESLGTASKNNVYVKGIVKGNPAPKINTTYKSLTYYISDDLANTTAGSIQVYSGKYFNGGDFTNDNILKEGDEVIVKGTIKSFNGTPEVDKNNELVSLNGQLAPTVEATEVNSIAETIALAETTPVKVNYPLTVAFVNDSNVFATDAAGDFIQLYGPNTLKVGDVIPAGWEGTFKLHNNVTPEIEINELPTPTEGTFTAKEVAAADITTALVNHVITIKNVDFEAATPADVANFTGMVGDTELSFRNNYSRESVEAGKYDVTVVVTIFNNAPSLYVVKYTKAETDSVIGIEAGDNAAPVEYYNLQGVRVDNPANGIFIRRQGSKAQKIVL